MTAKWQEFKLQAQEQQANEAVKNENFVNKKPTVEKLPFFFRFGIFIIFLYLCGKLSNERAIIKI